MDKKEWRGIAVYAEHDGESIHPVTLELLGKARELAEGIGHPVYVLVMGSGMEKQAEALLNTGLTRYFFMTIRDWLNLMSSLIPMCLRILYGR